MFAGWAFDGWVFDGEEGKGGRRGGVMRCDDKASLKLYKRHHRRLLPDQCATLIKVQREIFQASLMKGCNSHEWSRNR